jgi:hypothetical protein
MISKIIEEYYQKLCEEWELKNKTQPKIPYNKRVSTDFYLGKEDSEGYIEWKILKVRNPIVKNSMDKDLGIILHDDIYEFFNSYYFLDISGFIDDNEIVLHSLTPDTNHLIFLRRRFENLEINTERIRYIQLGDYSTSENSFLLCFDNDTGEIVYHDPENASVQIVSDSLEELLQKLTPRY